MIKELARDAIKIKMTAKEESPIISVYEFCYAAGRGCKIIQIPEGEALGFIQEATFADFKAHVQELFKDAKAAFEQYPDGARLYSLLVGCRIRGDFSEEAKELFVMGFSD